MKEYFYQGRLPHWQPPDATFFVTYRLYGSIPKPVIEALKADYEMALKQIEKEHAQNILMVAEKLSPEMQATMRTVLEKKQYETQKRYFKSFDDFLDSHILNEPHWLKNPDAARLEAANIQHYADRYFDLYAYCIMANHVHLLLKPKPGAPMLWKVLQDMKKYSGRQINRLLNRDGRFWERESYDHIVRDGEFERILWYILNNPVKAGIVKAWEEYPFTCCKPDLV